jgi:hypothetical protein
MRSLCDKRSSRDPERRTQMARILASAKTMPTQDEQEMQKLVEALTEQRSRLNKSFDAVHNTLDDLNVAIKAFQFNAETFCGEIQDAGRRDHEQCEQANDTLESESPLR